MVLRRRGLGAILAAVALVAAGCSPEKAERADPPAPSTTAATPTTSGATFTPATSQPGPPYFTVVDDPACRGLGKAPAGGEVTWTVGDELRSPRGCLLKFKRTHDTYGVPIAWNGAGDHLLVGGELIFTATGQVPMEPPENGWDTWSRPAGKALLFTTSDGNRRHLFKQPLDEPAREVTFLQETRLAMYHPAGMHLVAAGEHGGRRGLFMADNEGRDLRALAEGEDAEITDMAFTASGALLFMAKHGEDDIHLHRLEFDPSKLTTVAKMPKGESPFALSTSPFPGGGVAYATIDECSGERTLWASRDGKVLPTKGTAVEHTMPIGWLPDGTLVTFDGGGGCEPSPGDLFTFKDGKATRIAKDIDHASIRAATPPPPAPPKDIPSEAPA